MADRYDGMELDLVPMANMELELESLGVTPAQYAALDGRVQANTDAVGVLDGRVDEAETAVTELSDGIDARYTKDEVDSKFDLKADELNDRFTDTETAVTALTTELTTARNGETSLDERLDGMDLEVGKKANRQQEEWITPTLLNGATGTLKYRKNQFGVVEFKGDVTNIPYNEFFLTLPTGYYNPSSVIRVSPACSPAKAQLIRITEYGTMWQYTTNAQLSDRVIFDGVRFAID